jgi:hypothetical protein
VSTVPAGNAANAALVGANTVNGPGPLSVSTSPAALTAATSVVWSFELTALSMMSLSADIGAPPTIGLPAADAASVAMASDPIASADVVSAGWSAGIADGSATGAVASGLLQAVSAQAATSASDSSEVFMWNPRCG